MLDTYYKYNFIFNTMLTAILIVFIQYILKYDLSIVEILLIFGQIDLVSEIQKIKRGVP